MRDLPSEYDVPPWPPRSSSGRWIGMIFWLLVVGACIAVMVRWGGWS